MRLPNNCVVDTNVPKTANLASGTEPSGEVDLACVLACIKAIEHIISSGGLVIDAMGEILAEYIRQLSLSGQPGVGDLFVKWVHDHYSSLPESVNA